MIKTMVEAWRTTTYPPKPSWLVQELLPGDQLSIPWQGQPLMDRETLVLAVIIIWSLFMIGGIYFWVNQSFTN